MHASMQVVSVNVAQVETITHGNKSMTTGICKRPVEGPVRLTAAGFAGDAIVNRRHHGGPDQAVYAYSADDYDWWSETLGRRCEPGLFGENLTIRGMPTDLAIGDRLLIGDVVLEATSARIPCGTFAARMQDSGFGLAFRKAERPGTYFRVLNEGRVGPGDPVVLVPSTDGGVTVLDHFRYAFALRHDPETLERMLNAPLAERLRADVEATLEALRRKPG